jgi:hypothetical protein
MNLSSRWRRVAVRIVTLTLLLWLAGITVPAAVLAQGGLALSGSFHGQSFVIPQGASVSGPSIDVVVFNNGSEAMNIQMFSQSPPGVTISFSNQQFTIAPGGQKMVLIGVAVASDVAPGDYDLSVTAQSYNEGGTGIQVAGAAGQTARLKVTGESARVALRALSPDGQPLVATVRLYHVVNQQTLEVAYSDAGTLEATVAPGDFKAASYIGGQQVTEQTFTLAKGDNKTIDLTGATVYFASFGVLPAYARDSGKLAFVQVVYTVKNIYRQVDKGDVILQVALNNTSQSPLTLVTLSPLAVGSSGLNYNYTPTDGWVDGSYDFKLELNLDGKLYTSSRTEHFTVKDSGKTLETSPAMSSVSKTVVAGSTSPVISSSPLKTSVTGVTVPTVSNSSSTSNVQGINPALFAGIIAVVVLAAGILIFWFRRKK